MKNPIHLLLALALATPASLLAAAPAPIVDDGVFVGFLMGRSPIDGFPTSNGHGRRSAGAPPLAMPEPFSVCTYSDLFDPFLLKRIFARRA